MDKTEYIKSLIQNTGMSTKAFANMCDIPYTTLRSMLERGVENASVNNVIKVCKNLNICVETLYEECDNPKITKDEKNLLDNYNKLNDIGKKEANKRISELTEIPKYTRDTFKEPITIAAHDDNLTDNEKDEMSRRIEEFEKNLNK
ncbi:MAG: helix-turn-helix domain-containing protein [Clostridium sp.]|nr:helix-turn-helix domain-containing protein [Clostridium sp.]